MWERRRNGELCLAERFQIWLDCVGAVPRWQPLYFLIKSSFPWVATTWGLQRQLWVAGSSQCAGTAPEANLVLDSELLALSPAQPRNVFRSRGAHSCGVSQAPSCFSFFAFSVPSLPSQS